MVSVYLVTENMPLVKEMMTRLAVMPVIPKQPLVRHFKFQIKNALIMLLIMISAFVNPA